LKVLGSPDGDELDITLTAPLGCVLAGTGSPAKQLGKEQQTTKKNRIAAAVKTPFPDTFAIDLRRCDLWTNDFI
jgi:hypothetical protein